MRVSDKEYGPVTAQTLREWKADGRLIAENELRRVGDREWTRAGDHTLVFPDAQADAAPADERPNAFRTRTLGQILADTLRIYARGFVPFFVLALLVAIPSFVMKVSFAFVKVSGEGDFGGSPPAAIAIGVSMLLLMLAARPLFIGGVQFAAAELEAGRRVGVAQVVTRAREIWPRMAKLFVVVWSSYLFWIALPLLAILIIGGAPASGVTVLIQMAAFGFLVFMAGRLFINFMFWQQSAALGNLDGVAALKESKDLARSRPDAPRRERPLYRGLAIAALWLMLLVGFSFAAELPFLVARLQGVSTIDEARAVVQALANASAPDALTIATYVLSTLVHALLAPVIGIAFVLLYFDAKARL